MKSQCSCKKKEKNWLVTFDTGSMKRIDKFELCDDCEREDETFSKFRISVKRINEKSSEVN